MFLLLDKNRDPVSELLDWLSITASIRFSSPGMLTIVLSEDSDEANSISEMMHVYHVETSTLYLVDYIERNTVLNDVKTVTVKCLTIEGFLEQRIVFKDKLFDGANIQTALHELFNENAIAPEDGTRTLDFFTFVESSDTKITGTVVKGLVSGISVMQAITSILESKNMGYTVTYNMVTKKAEFIIATGRNLCAGFTSILHGANLLNTVTLSTQSETLKDIKSIVDLTPYKTRVYVKNFDDLKIFNRGVTKTGVDLREGYLLTGHGLSYGDDMPPVIPLPPDIIIPPPPPIPGPGPIPEPILRTELAGVYVLTNMNRLLACAFYTGLPVPEIWFDVTPTYKENEAFVTKASDVTIQSGDLVIKSSDHKRLYRSTMVGGLFGAKYFSGTECFFDVETRSSNNTIVGMFGVDIRTGRVVATLCDTTDPEPGFKSHYATLMDGTAYDLGLASSEKLLSLTRPGYFGWPMIVVHNDLITAGGASDTIATQIYTWTDGAWPPVEDTVMRWYSKGWHARPEPESDVMYYGDAAYGNILFRTKAMFSEDEYETTNLAVGQIGTASFSIDGKTMATTGTYGEFIITSLAPGVLNDSTRILSPRPGMLGQFTPTLKCAGINPTTGANQWGYLLTGTDVVPGDDKSCPSYFVSNNPTFTDPVNMTPLLKGYLALGPYGLDEDGRLNEWPIFAWPIIG